MIEEQLFNKLKRLTHVYTNIPSRFIIEEHSQLHYTQIQEDKAYISIGDKSPYRYIKKLSQEGYELFLEGLLFHEIALVNYTDYHIMSDAFQQAKHIQKQTNEYARDFIDKKISKEQLHQALYQYIEVINLPLILKTIEDGAIENTMGMNHPESWNALMFARTHIIKDFLKDHHDIQNKDFVMDEIIKEIMAICTYGYRFSLQNSIVYLPHYLPDSFESIRYLAVKGRLQTKNTQERLHISQDILKLCSPIIHNTVDEIIDMISQASNFSALPPSLFDSQNEIEVSFQNNQNTSPQETSPKYNIDLSQDDFKNIEALEDQNEKVLQQELLQEVYKRKKQNKNSDEKKFEDELIHKDLNQMITFQTSIRQTPSQYGQIALRSLNQSIVRSNKLARMLKRERMYAAKSTTKHKLDHGRKLDQPYLYRATLDGRVFQEHKQGKKKELCIYFLVDNSESMSGEKIISTMKGCYEVARVMQTLHIPFSIACHKSITHEKIQMTNLISFKESQKRQTLERIFTMYTSGGTHEDIALEYVLKELSQYKRHRKGFVFVLSDGETHGIQHIHKLIQYYKKEYDIDVIGIGIQTNPMITTTYPHSLFIKDINQLPDLLIKKLKEIAI